MSFLLFLFIVLLFLIILPPSLLFLILGLGLILSPNVILPIRGHRQHPSLGLRVPGALGGGLLLTGTPNTTG